jgi:hypothetical protein
MLPDYKTEWPGMWLLRIEDENKMKEEKESD